MVPIESYTSLSQHSHHEGHMLDDQDMEQIQPC